MIPSTPLFSPKRAKAGQPARICFLGESVAAGYLYAPHLTPAQVLQAQLRAADPDVAYEVVDLARTNETLAGLLTKLRHAVTLHPDVVVIFAGNNWNLLETPTVSPYFPSLAAKQSVAAAIRRDGILGPIEMAARTRLEKVAATLTEIQTIAQAAQVAVVWVIPEVNLADWWSQQPVAWLAGQATAQWYQLYFQAEQQLAGQAWAAAVATAQKMIALDGSTCPTAYRLLARAQMGLGAWPAAHAACMMELDSDQYALLGFMSAPRITPLEQGMLRHSAARHGFITVDLPTIFAHYTKSPLADRRLFLDYCHLTAEGMRVSMAGVTALLLRLYGHTDDRTAWQTLLTWLPEPARTAAVDATAQFGAAIHTAHRLLGPKQPLLQYWCQAALASSSTIGQTMLDFVRARVVASPIILTGAQQRNLQQTIPMGVQQGWHYGYLDRAMLQALETTLVAAGQITQAEFKRLLLTADYQQADLVDPAFYHWEPLARFYPDVIAAAELQQPAFYRSPWPVSSFCLLNNGRQPVRLALTARLPTHPLPTAGQAELWLNGQRVQPFAVNQHWQQHSLVVPARYMVPGINRLEVRWPYQALLQHVDGTTALEMAAARLEKGLEAHLHPVFGELFSLRATPFD